MLHLFPSDEDASTFVTQLSEGSKILIDDGLTTDAILTVEHGGALLKVTTGEHEEGYFISKTTFAVMESMACAYARCGNPNLMNALKTATPIIKQQGEI